MRSTQGNPLSHRNKILHTGRVPDVVTQTKFSDHRFRGFGDSGVEFQLFLLNCIVSKLYFTNVRPICVTCNINTEHENQQ